MPFEYFWNEVELREVRWDYQHDGDEIGLEALHRDEGGDADCDHEPIDSATGGKDALLRREVPAPGEWSSKLPAHW
jgi:hypothetical protein